MSFEREDAYPMGAECANCGETWGRHSDHDCPFGGTKFALAVAQAKADECPDCGSTPLHGADHFANCTKHYPRTAPQLLGKAAELMEQRGKQYDKPQGERSMGRAVAALNSVLGREALTESEGWLLMQILKDVRDRQTKAPHTDSLEDCVAYAALKAEARMAEQQP